MGRVVLINGAFGIGKTSVARTLTHLDHRYRISDPERIGYVLKRLPARLPWSTRNLGDYQDSTVWRRLAIRQVNCHAGRSSGVVLLPLCISDRGWFDALRCEVVAAGHDVQAFCLIGSWETVVDRLTQRGVRESSAEGSWVFPRARTALAAHRNGSFGELVATDALDVGAVARLLSDRIRETAPGADAL